MTSPSPMTEAELIEEFESFDDWNDRYRYIIELGDELPEMPAELKTEDTRVQGCQSNVWIVSSAPDSDRPDCIEFIADSDSQIVRGLIAILVMLLSNRTADAILATDVRGLFERMDLKSHLSRSRSNGLHSMIERIHELAKLRG